LPHATPTRKRHATREGRRFYPSQPAPRAARRRRCCMKPQAACVRP